MHGFDDRLGLDSLHADVVAVAGWLIGFVQAGTAEDASVENFDLRKILAVVLGVGRPEQADGGTLQGDAHVHRSGVVGQHAG